MRTLRWYESHISKMLKLLAVLGLAAVCFGSPLGALSGEAKLSPPIVGGEDADIKDYNYQLAVLAGGALCGGSIISQNWALTAAHCTVDARASQISIRAGSNNYNKGGIIYNVIAIHEHPQYDPDTFDYDFSLLEIDGPIEFGPGVAAIDLIASGVEVADGTVVTVSGYGTTRFLGNLAAQLQSVDVQIVSAADCKAAYGSSSITDRMLCAGVPEGGKDSCQGDSGGPLVADRVQVGVVSNGQGCANKNYPGVYSKISSVRDWIKDTSDV